MTEKKSRVSKLKAGIAALALGALLVIPAGAQDTADIEFTLDAGEFTATLDNAQMTNADFAATGMSTTGSVDVAVTDLRGGDGNWTVSLHADDFTHTNESDTIPASGLDVTDNELIDDSNGIGEVSRATPENLSDASEIATGEGAHGSFSWSPQLALDIPDGTQAGNYSSTLTLTSSVAPGGDEG